MKTSANDTFDNSNSGTICKFFNNAKGCRYGERCRYKHEIGKTGQTQGKYVSGKVQPQPENNSEISDKPETHPKEVLTSEEVKGAPGGSHDKKQRGTLPNKKRQIRQPLCRYFRKSGFCWDGDKCRFFHQKQRPKQALESGEIKPNSDGSENPQPSQVVKPVKRPENLSEKLSELTDEDLKYLQAIEIEQLKKRFGKDDLKMMQEDYRTVCMFKIKPSDPDWPYDINQVQLTVTFPNNYPKEIFKAEITDDDGQFPENFTKYINSEIEEYLQGHAKAQKLRDSPDLLFRPFLRWLDRNFENLFTNSLKQIKFEVEARSAGLEFIAFNSKDDSEADLGNGESETQITKSDDNLDDKKDKKLEGKNVVVELSVANDDDDDDDPKDPDDSEKSGSKNEDTSAMFEMIEAKKFGSSKKGGTEVRFRGMELHENTATVRGTSLTFTVQCGRCKNREEMSNVKENTNVVLTCSKCSNAQSIVFTSSEVVHQHSATLAYINPQGCLPIDLILSECQLMLGCLNCSKETSIKGINYGSTKNVWCHHCHNKLDIKIETARFHQLQPAIESDDKVKTIEVKKAGKNKDPVIKSGQALPDNGTCKHYKKSFRWLRFPCCGKCYPCDKCHDELGDGHEMEQATRMICGFCSKEQGFSQKGCVLCKSSMTAVHTSHWEGGKGCRNKIKMSRGDDKKYSDKNKTVSRHAIKVDGQKKK